MAKLDLRQFMESSAAKRLLPLAFALAFGVIGLSMAHAWRTRQIQALRREEARLRQNYAEPIHAQPGVGAGEVRAAVLGSQSR
jgi:hypothetical protein